MSTQNDWIVQQDFARQKAAREALAYGRHSANYYGGDLVIDYVPKHRLQQISDLGQLNSTVYYNQGRRAFVRGADGVAIT